MILRKPYAFLIKNFKKIHLILTFLLVYLAIKIYGIVKFFSEYASSGYYNVVSNIAGSHINIFMYIAVILILAAGIFIYMLMYNKKKNTKYYMALIIYYIIVFIMLSVSFGIFSSLEKASADVQMARIYRDVSLMISLPQYFFILYTFLRGCGFNLKQFNFQLDLKELEIEASDAEEVELTVGIETYKAKRSIRRFIREFSYYIKENTFIFICIISIVGLVIGTSIFMNLNVYHKVYKENKVIPYKTFNIKVNKSYLTNKDYSGKVILNNKYYLVLNVNILNRSTINNKIKLTDFRLKINNDNIYPTKNKMEYFVDLGTPYKEDKIKANSNDNYLLIYELDSNQIRKNYIIKILDSIDYTVGDLKTKYKDVKVIPQNLENITDKKEASINEEVSLNNSITKNSKLKITNYDIQNTYKYNYDFCVENECKVSTNIITPDYTKASNSSLIILDYEFSLDENSSIKNINFFFEQYAKIRVTNNDNQTVYDTKNLTTSEIKDKIVLQTDSSIKTADKIDLVLDIRNTEYIINLKS